MAFNLPNDAKPGDAVLAECPVCKKIVYVLVLPGSETYLPQVLAQMQNALEAHELLTGHSRQARKMAKEHANAPTIR